ncbi:MAG: nucleoside-diphosphate kinase [Candidatus Thermoplasmatota archaeon]|nr:nucleoside-diphosphate kinase [Candidatus Thermoplasmatota archaeon]MBU4072015.1 nucleoside-diphosphate kinase [Candidatus Thermoplasmatota archaeon]MBU4144546.1 nucleoside-diphosphate kinase [Candidatus Thermoplasmatota archaeon]MBU4592095.1 nucleoside-diphosphate kinase [Candidatus Thermoplasmatota archaeon]
MERTFVMVKPDGVQRGIVGQVISRFEAKGLKLVAAKFMKIDSELAAKHYGEHLGKPFYEKLVDFITSGPVMAMVWEGTDSISVVRTLVGKTNPKEAGPGTIRGDFGMTTGRNIIHASDSPSSAEREINLFFDRSEIQKYTRIDEVWLYE